MKRKYLRPMTEVCLLSAEHQLLKISAGTSDPKEGGDPAGGDGDTSNPFNPGKSNVWQFDDGELDM